MAQSLYQTVKYGTPWYFKECHKTFTMLMPWYHTNGQIHAPLVLIRLPFRNSGKASVKLINY